MTDLQMCRDLLLITEQERDEARKEQKRNYDLWTNSAKKRDEARYQIKRAIAQLQTILEPFGPFPDDAVESVVAQLEAFLNDITN